MRKVAPITGTRKPTPDFPPVFLPALLLYLAQHEYLHKSNQITDQQKEKYGLSR